MLVILERFDLRIHGSRSLKQKRHVVKALTAAITKSFNASVAEVDHQDLWQRAALGVALVGAEEYHLRRVMHEVEKLVDRWVEVEVIDRVLSVHDVED
jgi:uncharacterized protein YlxP (DUF503 family)